MSTIPRPESTDKMIEQLWFAVIGSNGDGIAATVRRHSHELQSIADALPLLMTRAEHTGCQDRERRSKWRATDIMLGVGVFITAVISAAGAFL